MNRPFFSDDLLDAIKTLFDTDNSSWTVTIDGVEYTYSNEGGASYKDADGNDLDVSEAGTYTVVLALAEGYDAWSDGTTEDITYVFTVFPTTD